MINFNFPLLLKRMSCLALIGLLGMSASFAQCPGLPAARLIQPMGTCLGTGTVSLGSGADYIIPKTLNPLAASAAGEYIDLFAFSGISNLGSGCINNASNYAFYNTMSAEVAPSATYSFYIESPSFLNAMGYGIWIDFNQDGDFNDAGEMVYSMAPTLGALSDSISIPPSATSGSMRMRVRTGANEFFVAGDAERTIDEGETEDYVIKVNNGFPVTYSWTSIPAGFTSNEAYPVTLPDMNTTYVLTVVDSATGCSSTTSVVVDSTTVYPLAFADNIWHAYVYSGSNFDSYEGFYTDSALSFTSQSSWSALGSPTDAVDYKGCQTFTDNFSVSYKRKGFPCGYYSLDIPQHSDKTSLYINDGLVFQDLNGGTNDTAIWKGFLDGNSKIEFRLQETDSAAFGALTLKPVTKMLNTSGSSAICEGTNLMIAALPATTFLWSTGASTSSIEVSVAGTYSVRMSAPSGCFINSDTVNVTVNPLPTVNVSSFNKMGICNSEITLSGGSPSGGTYSGPGVVNGFFFPRSGAGTHAITYTYTDNNGCSNTATTDITVDSLPEVALNIVSNIGICNSAITLTSGTPFGGSYSGTGVSGTTFDPSIGVGTYDISYTFTDDNGCPNTAKKSITVDGLPDVNAGTYASVGACNEAFTLENATPVGGSFSGTGVTNDMFAPSVGPGIYTITYTYTDSHGCTSSATTDITVDETPVVSAGTYQSFGECNRPFLLTNGSPYGGIYSGMGVNSQQSSFDPTIGPGTYTITYSYTDEHGCNTSSTSDIVVESVPSITVGTFPTTIAACKPAIELTGGSPAGGNYSGTGVSNNQFNPAGLSGAYTVTYSYTDAHGCTNIATTDIIVDPLPAVDAGSDTVVYDCDAPFQLTGGTPAGGNFSGQGVSNGWFYPTTGAGIYTVNYYYHDTNGCDSIASRFVTVDVCAGVKGVNNEGSLINLYPNPAHNVVTVEMKAGDAIKSITLTDVTGKEVMTAEKITGNKMILNVNELAKGLYFIKVTTADTMLVKKITIE